MEMVNYSWAKIIWQWSAIVLPYTKKKWFVADLRRWEWQLQQHSDENVAISTRARSLRALGMIAALYAGKI